MFRLRRYTNFKTTFILSFAFIISFMLNNIYTSINSNYLPNDIAGYYIKFIEFTKDLTNINYPLLIPILEGIFFGYPLDIKHLYFRYILLNFLILYISMLLGYIALKNMIFSYLQTLENIKKYKNKIILFSFFYFIIIIFFYLSNIVIKSFIFGPYTRLLGSISIVLLFSSLLGSYNSRLELLALVLAIYSHPVAGIFAYMYIFLYKIPIFTIKSLKIKFNIYNIFLIFLFLVGSLPYLNMLFGEGSIIGISLRPSLIDSFIIFVNYLYSYLGLYMILILFISFLINIFLIKNKYIEILSFTTFFIFLFILFYFIYYSKPFTIIQYFYIISFYFISIQIIRFFLFILNLKNSKIYAYIFLFLLLLLPLANIVQLEKSVDSYRKVYQFSGTSIDTLNNLYSILYDLKVNQKQLKNMYILGLKTRWYIVLAKTFNIRYYEAYSFAGYECITPRPYSDEMKNMLEGFINVIGDYYLTNGYLFISFIEDKDNITRSLIFYNLGSYLLFYNIHFVRNSYIIQNNLEKIKIVYRSKNLYFTGTVYVNRTSIIIELLGHNSHNTYIRIATITPLFIKKLDKYNNLFILYHKIFFMRNSLKTYIYKKDNGTEINISKNLIKILAKPNSKFKEKIIIKFDKYCSNIDALATFYYNILSQMNMTKDADSSIKNIIIIDESSFLNIYKYIEKNVLQKRKNIQYFKNINNNIKIYLIKI